MGDLKIQCPHCKHEDRLKAGLDPKKLASKKLICPECKAAFDYADRLITGGFEISNLIIERKRRYKTINRVFAIITVFISVLICIYSIYINSSQYNNPSSQEMAPSVLPTETKTPGTKENINNLTQDDKDRIFLTTVIAGELLNEKSLIDFYDTEESVTMVMSIVRDRLRERGYYYTENQILGVYEEFSIEKKPPKYYYLSNLTQEEKKLIYTTVLYVEIFQTERIIKVAEVDVLPLAVLLLQNKGHYFSVDQVFDALEDYGVGYQYKRYYQ